MIPEVDMWFLAFIWLFLGIIIEYVFKILSRLEKLTEKNREVKEKKKKCH